MHLPDAPYIRVIPAYAGSDARWGLDSLVALLDSSAKSVRKQFPDAIMSVGHLSKRDGGDIDRHASHESGRDADVGFYVKNVAGKPIYSERMVPFLADGTAPSWPGAHFDDARNWALVANLASDARAHVTHIFVSTPLRTRLLQYAEKIGAPPALRTRVSEVLAQPHGALPHDDHFHVRIGCPAGMDKCVEIPMKKHAHSAIAHSSAPAHTSHAPVHAAPHPPEHHAAAPKPPTPEPKASEEEASVPNLAPMIPGLDAALIPAPIPGVMTKKSDDQLIDDPDGVLEK